LYDPGGPLRPLIESADAVILGSYVPDGPDIARRLFELAGQDMVSFYDIDTPVTLAALRRGDCEYLDPADIPRFAAYFSFAGGRSLQRLGNDFAARRPLPLYCCVDPDLYHPDPDVPRDLDLGYMGTYSDDRQPTVQRLLLEPANQLPGQRFALVGPQYPQDLTLPSNVQRTPHLPPAEHRGFYNRQRFTLNVTRADMIEAGHSPSVRLFEAAACGTPLISDRWDGIEECFEPDREILLADDADDVVGYLRRVSEDDRQQLAERARRRILQHHTARVRSAQLLRALHLPCAADQPGPAQ
jgi:spore maturation protein CgeB